MFDASILEGQVALITGGSRGIGRGIAEALLEAGARIVINGRSREKGATALAEMGAGDRGLFIPGDVRRQADVEALVAGGVGHFGRLDILVNNAGGSSGFAPVAELDDAAWQEAAAWILHSAFWATRAALRHMVPRGYGRIINISSVEGRQVNKPAVAHYVTFKHALNGFTKAVAFEYGSQGITCNAISPGAVETDLMREAGPAAARSMGISYEAFKQSYAEEAAIKRLNTSDEIAAAALLLASPPGGGINGAVIAVDGGTAL